MIIDKEQRDRALSPRESFIIQAPAGSGKTELLVQRYLRLLTMVDFPEEILAITFTRKAVGEMRERIISSINQKNINEPNQPHQEITRNLALKVIEKDKKNNWNLIEYPSRLRIQTFDSLNSEFVQQMPLLAETGAPLDIHENPEQLYQRAASNTLRSLETQDLGPHIATLLEHLNNNMSQLEALLISMLEQRNQWLPHILKKPNLSYLKDTLEKEIERRLNKINSYFSDELKDEIVKLANFSAYNLTKNANNKSHIKSWHRIEKFPSTKYCDLKLWYGLSELILTKKDIRKSITARQGFPALNEKGISEVEREKREIAKKEMASLLKKLSKRKELILALQEITTLPLENFNNNHEKILSSLSIVLLRCASELILIFNESKKVDFIELGQKALRSLGNEDSPTDLTLSLDYKIKHILVDEFQDTSINQIMLLRTLTSGWQHNDGRSLFFVGDPMQSIYGFREAEVGLFLNIWKNGFGNFKLIPLTLKMNFRSNAVLVDWFNKTFTEIFPNEIDPIMGSVSYKKSRSAIPESPLSKVKILLQSDRDDSDEAKKIEQEIRFIRKNNPDETIGILARSRNHLKHLAMHLRASDISFHASDIDLLHDRQVIQDLRSLTRALCHPADKLSWLSVLRAPWLGLNLSDLLKIGEKNDEIIYKRLEDKATLKRLSSDGKKRVERLLGILKDEIPMQGVKNIRSWIEGIWLSLGGFAIAGEENRSDANSFFQLIEKIDQSDGYLDLNELDMQINKLYASPDYNADEKIQLMTMHAAKGLEFDTVIIPGLGKHQRRKESKLLNWIELPKENGGVELLLAPIRSVNEKSEAISEFLKNIEKRKGYFEEIRLLYVAATRARQKLILLGHVVSDKDKNLKPNINSFLNMLWPLIKNELNGSKKTSIQQAENIKIHEAESRLPNDWAIKLNKNLELQVIETEESNIEFQWASDTARHIGTVVHRYLEKISIQGLTNWPLTRVDSMDQQIRIALMNLGVQINDLENAIIKTKKAIKNTLSDDIGKWILNKHIDGNSELALTINDTNNTNIVIDRTFIDENQTRWIIDYKTGDHLGDDIEKFLDDEQNRYYEQLNRYAAIMAQKEDNKIQLGLYFPLLKKWRYWEYQTKNMSK